ncbi:MAG: hypothetical protein R2771_04040 [Saprospiraceae bacterium]
MFFALNVDNLSQYSSGGILLVCPPISTTIFLFSLRKLNISSNTGFEELLISTESAAKYRFSIWRTCP